jgi:histidinol-phosphate aminotransferase
MMTSYGPGEERQGQDKMIYERENIREMTGYVPGEQPSTLDVVKLNTNENPYPPSEAVMQALHSIGAEVLRRYPSPTAHEFREVAARMHDLTPENVIAVNGGDELLRLVITTFVDPSQTVGVAEPSYSLYPVLAAIQNCPVVRVPLQDDWAIPRDFARRMNAAGAKLAILVNPHAPSGYLTSADRLAAIAEELKGVLLIDEAYVDFVAPELDHNAFRLVKRHKNILILRTLSKGYSLAGLRFGYGLGADSIIAPMLGKTKDSYNVDAVAQRLAVAALTNRHEAAKTWEAVRAERKRMIKQLSELSLTCPVSQSNFVLAQVPDHVAGGARRIYESLKARSILVRYFDQDRLRDKLRITIGKPGENEALLAALKELIGA